jgi:hypothetical protein
MHVKGWQQIKAPHPKGGLAYCICIDCFEKRTLPASPYSIVSTARPRVVRSAAAAPKEGEVRATAAVVRSKKKLHGLTDRACG